MIVNLNVCFNNFKMLLLILFFKILINIVVNNIIEFVKFIIKNDNLLF